MGSAHSGRTRWRQLSYMRSCSAPPSARNSPDAVRSTHRTSDPAHSLIAFSHRSTSLFQHIVCPASKTSTDTEARDCCNSSTSPSGVDQSRVPCITSTGQRRPSACRTRSWWRSGTGPLNPMSRESPVDSHGATKDAIQPGRCRCCRFARSTVGHLSTGESQTTPRTIPAHRGLDASCKHISAPIDQPNSMTRLAP